jgi:thiol:disulfide interchange protein DsbC
MRGVAADGNWFVFGFQNKETGMATGHIKRLMDRSNAALRTMAALLLVLGIGMPALAAEGLAVQRLRELRPDLPITRVLPSPVPGFVAVEIDGGSVLYASEDGKYLFAGDLYRLDTTLVNVTDGVRAGKRKEKLAKVPKSEMVVFSPKNVPVRKSVFVFTDVDCGYCRKLHLEMQAINDLGIEVKYLAYPRAGIGSDAYQKVVTAWCSDDRNAALTDLKLGKNVKEKSCPNPVADQYALGRDIGITGTPAIVTDEGELLPGYMPAADLAMALGLK